MQDYKHYENAVIRGNKDNNEVTTLTSEQRSHIKHITFGERYGGRGSLPKSYSAPYGTNPQRNNKQRTSKRYVPSTMSYKDYIGNPVVNHKVEQVLRSVIDAELCLQFPDLVNIDSTGGTFYHELQWLDDVDCICVGIADERGYRFTPSTNSLLIRMGYNPNVLLYSLCCAKDSTGNVTVGSKGSLLTKAEALVLCAYDLVFNYDNAYKLYQEYRVKHKDNPLSVLT